MTEAEWLACDDPLKMLEFLRDLASDRKLRLFAVACCRRIWDLLVDPTTRRAVEVAERHADGQAPEEERDRLAKRYFEATTFPTWQMDSSGAAGWAVAKPLTTLQAGYCATLAVHAIQGHAEATGQVVQEEGADHQDGTEHLWRPMKAEQAALLRDVFGNPFRPSPTIDPDWVAWNGGTVKKLAQATYDERLLPGGELDPERLAVLADALEDAGSTDADILNHLRRPVSHVRGCWVLDLLLARR